MPRKPSIPSLRRHKVWSLAVTTLNGKDHYLGHWPADQVEPPPEVRAAYDAKIAEWLASARGVAPAPQGQADSGPTVEEVLAAFWAHAQVHYRHADGRPTREQDNYAVSLRPLRHLYGSLPAREFSPLKLKAVRELMVRGYDHPKHGAQPPLSRKLVNKRIGRIVRAFKWAVEEELIPVEVHTALAAVRGLQRGRTEAHETDAIPPVDVQVVEQTIPHLRTHPAGMVRVQLLTGMRPGEVCLLRLDELDRSGEVWLFRPKAHKTAWRGKARVVAIGPKAQAVLREFIQIRCPLCGVEGRPPRIGCRDGALCGPCADKMDDEGAPGPWPRVECQPADAYLFSPERCVREREEDMRARRRSRVQPSQMSRKRASPKRLPGDRYTATTYGRAVTRACAAAGVPHWHPNQLRHTHATEVRRLFGLEAAQVALGHSQANTTEIYAERNMGLAVKVAKEFG